MSRTSTPVSNRIKSPIKHYIEFGGANGVWGYWDGEKNVQLDILEFVVMDVRSSIGGWSEAKGCRIHSNIVKSTKTPFVVKADKAVLLEGPYADIKNDIAAAGGKFVCNVFALARIGGDWVPVDIQLSGASLRDWTQFVEAEGNIFKVYEKQVSAARGAEQKKGAVKYFTPDFVSSELDESVAEMANSFCDEQLMPYLEQ